MAFYLYLTFGFGILSFDFVFDNLRFICIGDFFVSGIGGLMFLFVRSGFDVDMFLLVNFKHFTIYIGEKV
jgi:hypothetical protein